MKLTFFIWLRNQLQHQTPTGEFARQVLVDPFFPRAERLYKILAYLEGKPELRRAAKTAHAKWRKSRREKGGEA